MNIRIGLSAFRLLIATLALAAVTTDYTFGKLTNADFSSVNYFSFFTILSCLFAATILVITVVYKDLPFLRGAATLYMLVTGIVYFLLLRNEPIQIFWVNVVFHYVTPAALLIDWIIDSPKEQISFKTAFLWLLFPAGFVVYSLVRGEFTGWYPYPFLDVIEIGYGQVALNTLFVGLGIAALVFVVVGLQRLRMRLS